MKQFIVDNYSAPEPEIKLSGHAFKYLVRVRRQKPNDKLFLRFPNGEKKLYAISNINFAKQELFLEMFSNTCKKSVKPTFNLILLQWLLKANKMDLVVRQSAEVGVRFVLPVYGDFSVVQNQNNNRYIRYKRIIKNALQQSGASVTTEVLPAVKLTEAFTMLSQLSKKLEQERNSVSSKTTEELKTLKLYFTEKNLASKTLHENFLPECNLAILAIGCESGISQTEQNLLDEAGFIQCHFQTNVLRAETAALYALATVQTLKMEEKIWQLRE